MDGVVFNGISRRIVDFVILHYGVHAVHDSVHVVHCSVRVVQYSNTVVLVVPFLALLDNCLVESDGDAGGRIEHAYWLG